MNVKKEKERKGKRKRYGSKRQDVQARDKRCTKTKMRIGKDSFGGDREEEQRRR